MDIYNAVTVVEEGDEARATGSADFLEQVTEPDPLAEKWAARLEKASKASEPYFKRCKHNRKLVDGFNWRESPESAGFVTRRANLIQGTITTLLPTVYARNPEIEVRPTHGDQGKLLAHTLETVLNRLLTDADLKVRAKAAVRAALTTSIGCLKVCWQESEPAPVAVQRIQDSRDNIDHVAGLTSRLQDAGLSSDSDAIHEELSETVAALDERAEITAGYGLVVDRVMIDNLLIDPAVQNFEDYTSAGWIAQIIPMRRSEAEERFRKKLDGAKVYTPDTGVEDVAQGIVSRRIASASRSAGEDDQICIYEIWDKASQRVYTMAEGCRWWLREPYSPAGVGKRWYPFFLLPYQVVDGCFVGPSLVDLTEKLQDEHNKARDNFNAYRELCSTPGWIASSDVKPSAARTFVDSRFGEVILLDIEQDSLGKSIIPRPVPQVNAAVYDTTAVRQDWEMVSGLQDAARSSVVKAKTATEAKIMQNSQAGRVVEFTDQVEDWLSDLAVYSAEICLQHMDRAMIERIMGTEDYDWPEMLTKEDVFYMVDVSIRAGSTGKPDKVEVQETWQQMLPTLLQMIQQIAAIGMQGGDVEPYKYLLQQTVSRFDDSIDLAALIPEIRQPQPPQPPAAMAPAEGQAEPGAEAPAEEQQTGEAPADIPPELLQQIASGGAGAVEQ